MQKSVEVFTNDPIRSRIVLSISGSVLNFARIEPKYARLVGKAGTAFRKEITITREKAYPFTILQANARNGKNIAFSIEEFSKGGVDGYLLTIENKRTEAGRYADTLTLITDSPIKSTLRIPVYGQVVPVKPPSPSKPLPKKTSDG